MPRLILVFLALLVYSVGAEERQHNWKLIMFAGKNSEYFGEIPVHFAKAVHELTNGTVNITCYGLGSLTNISSYEDMFNAVTSGKVEMLFGAPAYWKFKEPAAQMFSGIPFGMVRENSLAWMMFGGGNEFKEKLFEPYGIVPLLSCGMLSQPAGWFNKKIESVEDFRGLRFRILGTSAMVMERLGVNVSYTPSGEIINLLKDGSIDAAEWAGPYFDLQLGLHTVCKYYYQTGWLEPGGLWEFMVNKAALETLSSSQKAALKYASHSTMAWGNAYATHLRGLGLRQLNELKNITVMSLPNTVVSALAKETRALLDETAAQDPKFDVYYNSYRFYRAAQVILCLRSQLAYIPGLVKPMCVTCTWTDH